MPGLLVVRHAQSTWNVEGRWQGQADPPLSARGEEQARMARRGLGPISPVDLVVSSDLVRAVRTAEVLVAAMRPEPPVTLEPLLREYDVGDWSGLTRGDIERRWPGYLARFDEGRLPCAPGGEDRVAFDERVKLASIVVGQLAARLNAKRVLVVAHGGVVRSLARAAGLPPRPIPFLSGYWGRHDESGLWPQEPVDLVEADDPRDRHTPGVPSAL